jgi:hypothetical protein
MRTLSVRPYSIPFRHHPAYIVPAEVLPCPAHSYISNYFFARCVLIALMMEVVNIFETSVSFYKTTTRYIPEDSHLIFTAVRTRNLTRIELICLSRNSLLGAHMKSIFSWNISQKPVTVPFLNRLNPAAPPIQ